MDNVVISGKRLGDFAYRYAKGLWVITPYYNPVGYKTRRRNYEIFIHLLRVSGIPVLTVECAFGDQPFDLPESLDVIKLRGTSLLWQKERLLNLAISLLPSSCDSVAWLDCDLIFTDPDWVRKTIAALQKSSIVQVFETCDRLPQHFAEPVQEKQLCTSFASIVCRDQSVLDSGKYHDHGHPGYGWAARREVLDKHGLYELAIAGSADHYMAHAAVGDLDSPCIKRMMFNHSDSIRCFREWSEKFNETVQGQLGVVPGEILHLWHGELEHRRYYLRQLELAQHEYNPYTDLSAIPGKLLELHPGKPGLAEWLTQYFLHRQEDGVSSIA